MYLKNGALSLLGRNGHSIIPGPSNVAGLDFFLETQTRKIISIRHGVRRGGAAEAQSNTCGNMLTLSSPPTDDLVVDHHTCSVVFISLVNLLGSVVFSQPCDVKQRPIWTGLRQLYLKQTLFLATKIEICIPLEIHRLSTTTPVAPRFHSVRGTINDVPFHRQEKTFSRTLLRNSVRFISTAVQPLRLPGNSRTILNTNSCFPSQERDRVVQPPRQRCFIADSDDIIAPVPPSRPLPLTANYQTRLWARFLRNYWTMTSSPTSPC